MMRYLILTLLLCLQAPLAQAQRWDNGLRAQQPSGGGNGGLSAAISRVEANTGGRVLSAEPVQSNGQRQYRIKLLTPKGRVRIMYVDAR